MDDSKYKKIITNLHLTQGYGTNKNWAGFFERKINFKKAVLTDAIDFFLNYFKNDLDNFIIASSFYFDLEKLQSKTQFKILKDVAKAEENLLQNKHVDILNFEEYFDCNNEEAEQKLLYLDNNFKFFKSNKELLKNFSLIAMSNSHLGMQDGHCFFISLKNNIIIYPHGDLTGYGCFFIELDTDNVAIDFLEKAGTLKSFKSIINKSDTKSNAKILE